MGWLKINSQDFNDNVCQTIWHFSFKTKTVFWREKKNPLFECFSDKNLICININVQGLEIWVWAETKFVGESTEREEMQ